MKFIFSVAALLLLLTSCQKEVASDINPDTGGPGGGTGNTNGKLVKTVSITGTDTLTTVYAYDSQGRVESQTDDGKSGGMLLHSYRKFERDAAGRIIRILQKLDQNGMSSDTAINQIHYPNATTMEFDYSVHHISLMGFTTVDSSVYTYSAGKLARVNSYMSMPALGLPEFEATRIEFIYDAAGRVSLMKMYSSSDPADPVAHTLDQTYTYGTTSAFSYLPDHPAQRYWVGGLPGAGNELVTTHQIQDFSGTAGVSRTMTWNYVMSGNKPVSATVTSTTGQTTRYTFHYQ